MFKRKNKDGMNMTALVDTIVTALQMENEEFTIESNDKLIVIKWKHHIVTVQGEYVWFDNKVQRSVYNIINCIKAGN